MLILLRILLQEHIWVFIASNNLTIEKVGVYAFGIIGSDPPKAVPQPFDEPETSKGKGKALLTVAINNNTVQFSGPDNTATYGIEVDAGWGPNDLSVTGTGNSATGFEVGFEIYMCESSCDVGVFTGVAFNYNNIVGNTIGMRSNVNYLTVDGTCNWWGTTDAYAVEALVNGDIQFLPFSSQYGTTVEIDEYI